MNDGSTDFRHEVENMIKSRLAPTVLVKQGAKTQLMVMRPDEMIKLRFLNFDKQRTGSPGRCY